MTNAGQPLWWIKNRIIYPYRTACRTLDSVLCRNNQTTNSIELAESMLEYQKQTFGPYPTIFSIAPIKEVEMNERQTSRRFKNDTLPSHDTSVAYHTLHYGLAWNIDERKADEPASIAFYDEMFKRGVLAEYQFKKLYYLHDDPFKQTKNLGMLFKLSTIRTWTLESGGFWIMHRSSINLPEAIRIYRERS